MHPGIGYSAAAAGGVASGLFAAQAFGGGRSPDNPRQGQQVDAFATTPEALVADARQARLRELVARDAISAAAQQRGFHLQQQARLHDVAIAGAQQQQELEAQKAILELQSYHRLLNDVAQYGI